MIYIPVINNCMPKKYPFKKVTFKAVLVGHVHAIQIWAVKAMECAVVTTQQNCLFCSTPFLVFYPFPLNLPTPLQTHKCTKKNQPLTCKGLNAICGILSLYIVYRPNVKAGFSFFYLQNMLSRPIMCINNGICNYLSRVAITSENQQLELKHDSNPPPPPPANKQIFSPSLIFPQKTFGDQIRIRYVSLWGDRYNQSSF